MKKILSTVLAIVLFVSASQAQSRGEARGRNHGRGGEMMKELDLSAEQKAKLKIIHEAERKEMQALRSNGNTEAGNTARKEIREKYRMQIESVLTVEQKEKLKKEKKEAREDRTDGRADRMEDGRAFGRELNLSADQKTKVTSLNQEFASRVKTIKSNTSLTADEKRAQMKSLTEEHRTKLLAMLTPEQAAKMKSLRNDHQKGRKENS